MITTLIQNFKRTDFLKRALSSVAAAGAPNVVVASCGTSPEVEHVHDWAKASIPGVVVVSRKDDPGFDAHILFGLDACGTDLVHILHDDDVVLPGFYGAASKISGDIDAALVEPFFQGPGMEVPSRQALDVSLFDPPRSGGRIPAPEVLERLMRPGSRPFGPVNGIYPTRWAKDAYRESEKALSGDGFRFSPTVAIGSDLLLWIRICQRSRNVYYEKTPLVGYGNHDGSITVQYWNTGRWAALTRMYDDVREYVRSCGI